MEKVELCIFILFFLIIGSLALTLFQINRFMPILDTCKDDFAVINKCGCVPYSWKDSIDYNKIPNFNINISNLSDG
jgi:hypothetical protein